MIAPAFRFAIPAGAALLWAVLLGACYGEKSGEPRYAAAPAAGTAIEYSFGAVPQHNPEHLFAAYGPMTRYLSAEIPGARFRLEASRNYADFETKIYSRSFHFALANPYQTIRAIDHGYRVFAKMGDDDDFRGLIVVRRDSGLERLADLKGRTVSFLAPTTVGTTMQPQYFLQSQGLDVNRDIHSLYVETHESSLMNVYYGFAAAGATRPGPWRSFQQTHPEEARALAVKWEAEEEKLPHNAFIVRDDAPQDVAERVEALLTSLQRSGEGRKILDAMPISHIAPATNETYEPARAFLRRFSREVRPLEGLP